MDYGVHEVEEPGSERGTVRNIFGDTNKVSGERAVHVFTIEAASSESAEMDALVGIFCELLSDSGVTLWRNTEMDRTIIRLECDGSTGLLPFFHRISFAAMDAAMKRVQQITTTPVANSG